MSWLLSLFSKTKSTDSTINNNTETLSTHEFCMLFDICNPLKQYVIPKQDFIDFFDEHPTYGNTYQLKEDKTAKNYLYTRRIDNVFLSYGKDPYVMKMLGW